MRCCHISDTHGNFVPLFGSFDCVIHSGDLLPDPPGRPQFKEEIGLWQLDWVEENIEHFRKWIGNYPFLFTLGNHDHVDPIALTALLYKYGIQAYCLHDKITSFEGVNFYGFPYVPFINGAFAYERELPEMNNEIDKMVSNIESSHVDVLVCHAPPYGILDFSYDGKNLGSSAISNAISYQKIKINYYLCGHIHHSRGISILHDICFSNAACFQQILEI